jgi:hypothetical protein
MLGTNDRAHFLDSAELSSESSRILYSALHNAIPAAQIEKPQDKYCSQYLNLV